LSENNLSPCEWAVMSALWEKSPQPLGGVIETVGGAVDWNYRTYATYLRRLCGKGLAGFEMRGRDKLYYPLVEKDACIRAEGRSLMRKLEGRAAKELLVYMIRESGLSPEDHEELQRLLERLSKGGGQ
jgi:BlaI family penicillinase repressor